MDISELEDTTISTSKHFVKILENSPTISSEIEVFFLESSKYLRLMCTKGPSFQNLIAKTDNMLAVLKNLINNSENSDVNKLKSIQLVANLCVNNPANQKEIWKVMSELIVENFKSDNQGIVNASGMILYNIILEKSCQIDQKYIATIALEHYEKFTEKSNDSLPDFVQILLEHFICESPWIVEYFKSLKPETQKTFLYFVNDHIENESNM